jgi:amino acid transporter
VAAPARGGLRRELRFWEAIALSIGIMAPTAAMALNGTLPASLVGQAVPLVFVLATVGVLFVMWGFVRLSRTYSHAGSVYAFTGLTLGPRAGFVAGWALLGTYLAFTVGSTAEVGVFLGQVLDSIGWGNPGWFSIALVAGVLVAAFAYGDVRVATRTLLLLELVSVTLIVVLIVVILAKVGGGSAPCNQSLTLDDFRPGSASLSTLGVATVFAFLSFAGFEGAATLGEETADPGRTIPRAIQRAVLVTGGFYILCIYAQTVGFGTDAPGTTAFAGSLAPLGDLGRSYVSSSFADLLNLGAAISGFASALGTATGGSRILYALGRDGFVTTRLGETSRRFGSPANALAVVMAIAFAALLGLELNGTSGTNPFFYPGTIGVLSLIVAYALTNLGAGVRLVGRREVPAWEAVFPVGALLFLGYVLYKQVYPVPIFPYDWFPYVVAAWLLVAIVVVVAVPGLARRIGEHLSAEAAPPARAGDAQ